MGDQEYQATFRLKTSYGRPRYYPVDKLAKFICHVVKKKSLRLDEIQAMAPHGIGVHIMDAPERGSG